MSAETTNANVDWHKWCRLCARCDAAGNISVFQTNEDKMFDATLAAAIGKYFWVNIKIDDALSRDLCQDCHKLMTELIKFAERVNKVQAMYCVLQNIGTNASVNPNDVRKQYGLLEEDFEHIIKSKTTPNTEHTDAEPVAELKSMHKNSSEEEHVEVDVEQIVEFDSVEYVEEEQAVKCEPNDNESTQHLENSKDKNLTENSKVALSTNKSPQKQRYIIKKKPKSTSVEAVNESELDSDEKELEFEFMPDMDNEDEIDVKTLNTPTVTSVVSKETEVNYKCDLCFKVYKSAACFRKHILQGHNKSSPKVMAPKDVETSKDHTEFEVEFVSDGEAFDDEDGITDTDIQHSNSENKDDEEFHNDTQSDAAAESSSKQTRKRRHRRSSLTDHFIKVAKRSEGEDSSSASGPRYQCEICNKPYKSPNCYRKHMIEAHNKEANIIDLPCDKCDQTFFTEKQLANHKRRHLPASEKLDYECSYCERKFTTIGALRQHVSGIHFDEKPFICDECGKPLRTLAALNEHKLVHTDDTPVECEVCGKGFKNKARMKVHMDTHASTEYTCNICGLCLNTRRTLKMHMLVHTDEKQYKCTFCPAAFKRTKALKNHLILHTGLRPYVCNFCKKTFSNGSNCRAHKKKVHPVELAKEEQEGKPAERTSVPNLNELRASSKVANPRKVTRSGGLSQRMRALIIAAEQREMMQNIGKDENDTMDTMQSFVVEEEDLSNLISDSQNEEDDVSETIIYEVIETI